MSHVLPLNANDVPEELAFVRSANPELVLMPVGTFVFREHEGCGRVGFVVSGTIRVYKEHSTGRSITLYRLGPGDACALAMSCALNNPIHQASAIVEEEARVLTVSIEAFQHLVDKSREAREYLYASFATRLTDAMMLIEEIAFHRMDERLAAILLEYGARHHSDVIVITHEQLAEEAGTAREVVTRLLHDFNQRGYVKLSRGHIQIIDRKGLARISSSRSSVL